MLLDLLAMRLIALKATSMALVFDANPAELA